MTPATERVQSTQSVHDPDWRVWAMFIGLALSIAAVALYRARLYFVDDAYISLRYIQNFLNGNGLVWNVGERVEGYTNFLYMMSISLFGWFGLDLAVAARAVSTLALSGLVVFIIRYMKRTIRSSPDSFIWAPVVLLFVLAAFPLATWTLGGLETVLYTLLVTVGVWKFYDALTDANRRIAWLGIVFGLATMTRPDGVLFFLGSVFFGVIGWRKYRRPAGRDLLAFIVCGVILIGGHVLWRYSYYGELLPNTYYVKSALSWDKVLFGGWYLLSYLATPPFLLLLFLVQLVYTSLARCWNIGRVYLAVLTLGFMLYIARVGGDHMAAFRMMVPLIPIMALFLFDALRVEVPQVHGRMRWVVPAAVLVLTLLQITNPGVRLRLGQRREGAAFFGHIIGEYIARQWPSHSLIALNTAGSTPYFAPDNQYIDMLGLNDKHIARQPAKRFGGLRWERVPGHEKGDGFYVISRRPNYIILGPADGIPSWSPWFRSDVEVKATKEFRNDYRLRQVPVDVTSYPGIEQYRATRSGQLEFTYYERIVPRDSTTVGD